jgi:hypothetical protein
VELLVAWSPEEGGHWEEECLAACSSEEGEHREEEEEQGGHQEEDRVVVGVGKAQGGGVARRACAMCAAFFPDAPSPAQGSGWKGHPVKYRPIYRLPLRADFGRNPLY